MESAKEDGDLLLVGGQVFPKTVAAPRKKLVERVLADGYERAMEAIAYTWFNRLVAIRFMELHGYLDHGYRVLSHPEGQGRPEILDHATEVDLPGLDRDRVLELKLDGARDEELYQLLLKAQCDALHRTMPFLFTPIGNETELLLPDNLLHTDSLVRKLVEEVDEEAWEQIEIIGWLYQFYISEKKDQVIGKVVKSEDIPAATQLFTPNWIVKYMVQNSLGAQWLATYPHSPLKGQMEYYIEPAEQTDEVKAQLADITPSTLNPEELTLMDPACGSGHILVEAYSLFKAIYLERGYRKRDVARLILEKNLFGLDIDERAAQLTGFALMMKGRADDRRLFERGVTLNVMALVDSTGFDTQRLAQGVKLSDYGLQASDLTELKQLFEHATTFGSLIQIPEGLAAKLPALKQLREVASQDLFVSEARNRLESLVQQAELLARPHDAVVMNPPYMGSGGMNARLKKFVRDKYSDTKADLFACFMERSLTLARGPGWVAMITMHSWMFLSGFERMRERLLRERTIQTMAHLGARAFGSISGEVVQTTCFALKKNWLQGYKPAFFRLLDGGEEEKRAGLCTGRHRYDSIGQVDFAKIPGSPIAYWASYAAVSAFEQFKPLANYGEARKGLVTLNDGKWIRQWYEIDCSYANFTCADRDRSIESTSRWFPLLKGGEYRKWFGNHTHVIDWKDDGAALKSSIVAKYGGGSYTKEIRSEEFYFRPGLHWTKISSNAFSARISPAGFLLGDASCCLYPADNVPPEILASFLNSHSFRHYLEFLAPTLNFKSGDIEKAPLFNLTEQQRGVLRSSTQLLETQSRTDWNAYERSWDFQFLPLLTASTQPTPTLASSYTAWITQNRDTIAEMKRLEEENNRLFIDAYGLKEELASEVPMEQITLTVNPVYRYPGTKKKPLTESEQWTRFRQDTMQELVSYAIGCMMGRYSLDAPCLVYAHSGNEGFDQDKYKRYPADDDGIIPITDTEWFDDDAANRLIEFIAVAWDASHLEENLTFLADNLSPRKNEQSRGTIRRYLSDKFFKDHLKTYKKRPIYWLFSSGKQKAFQCLVYLHRYNEGTLSRMRSTYVIPLQGKLTARIETLQGDIQSATSSAHRKRLEKELAKREKQQVELIAFDEKLRHHADQRITLDLDDGVKVNYGKFGDLLAEVKAVHGKKPEVA